MSVNIARALKSHSRQRLFIIYRYLPQDSQNLFSIERLFFFFFFKEQLPTSWFLVVNKSHLQPPSLPTTPIQEMRHLLILGSAWKDFIPDTKLSPDQLNSNL